MKFVTKKSYKFFSKEIETMILNISETKSNFLITRMRNLMIKTIHTFYNNEGGVKKFFRKM